MKAITTSWCTIELSPRSEFCQPTVKFLQQINDFDAPEMLVVATIIFLFRVNPWLLVQKIQSSCPKISTVKFFRPTSFCSDQIPSGKVFRTDRARQVWIATRTIMVSDMFTWTRLCKLVQNHIFWACSHGLVYMNMFFSWTFLSTRNEPCINVVQ